MQSYFKRQAGKNLNSTLHVPVLKLYVLIFNNVCPCFYAKYVDKNNLTF